MAKKQIKNNGLSVMVDPSQVAFTSISTSADGYNSARIVSKIGDGEYMSVGYEWQGKGIPAFVMDLMAFMKSNNVETSGIWEGKEDDYAEYSAKLMSDSDVMKNMSPDEKKKYMKLSPQDKMKVRIKMSKKSNDNKK
jgi:hypothetical protein